MPKLFRCTTIRTFTAKDFRHRRRRRMNNNTQNQMKSGIIGIVALLFALSLFVYFLELSGAAEPQKLRRSSNILHCRIIDHYVTRHYKKIAEIPKEILDDITNDGQKIQEIEYNDNGEMKSLLVVYETP